MAELRVAILQNECRLGRPDCHFNQLESAAEARAGSIDLLVCPELFMTGYNIPDRLPELAEPFGGPFMMKVSALAAKHGLAIAYGYPETTGEALYNAAAVIDRTGTVIANHRKMHHAPGFERSRFATGNKMTYFEIGGIRAAVLICYDVEFPECVRAAALGGAHLIVVPTALRERYAHVATAMIPTRALENGVFVAYANPVGGDGDFICNGLSCIVDPHGHDLARAGTGPEVIAAVVDSAEVERARSALPYLQDRRFDIRSLEIA